MSEYKIEIGDMVHGRLYNEEKTGVVVQNFTVTSIEGTIYRGGVLDCDTSAGWSVELINKSAANLNLPQSLSEITAYDIYGKKYLLTGKGEIWRDENGVAIGLNTIVNWENGHV